MRTVSGKSSLDFEPKTEATARIKRKRDCTLSLSTRGPAFSRRSKRRTQIRIRILKCRKILLMFFKVSLGRKKLRKFLTWLPTRSLLSFSRRSANQSMILPQD